MPGFGRRLMGSSAADQRARNAAQTEANNLGNTANQLLQERSRLAQEVGRIADRNSRQYMDAVRRQITLDNQLNDLQERRAELLQRSRSILQHGFRDAAQSAGQMVQQGISGAADQALQQVMANARRAQQALLQTHRQTLPSAATYGAVLAEYTSMLDEAVGTAVRYGMTVDEVSAAQHRFIQAMNIDVAAGNFSHAVSTMVDQMALVAARTGQSIDEVEAFATSALDTFGRGGEAQIESYGRTMTALTQIPVMMAAQLQDAGQEVGDLFSNQRTQLMIQEWTQQFGDQAANIAEMAAAMGLFQKRAALAGHSTRTITTMTTGLFQSLQGATEDSAMNVRAGQILRQRIQSDPSYLAQLRESHRQATGEDFSEADLNIINQLVDNANALSDIDLANMLRGTAEGMDAFMEGLVGVGEGTDISVVRRMLEQQHIDTGSPQNNLRLAQLIQQGGAGGVIETDEINRLLQQAGQSQASQENQQSTMYRNIGVASEAAARSAELLSHLDNTTKSILLVVGGGAQEVYNQLVEAETARNLVAAPTSAQQVRQRFQEWRDTSGFFGTHSFDVGEAGDRSAMLQQLSAARRSLSGQEYQVVLRNLQRDLDLEDSDVASIETDVQRFMLSQDRARMENEERNRARHAIDQAQPPTPPVTPPSGAARRPEATPAPTEGAPVPGGQGASNVGTQANPLTPIRPGDIRVNPNGSATIQMAFNVSDFTGALARGNAINAQNAPTGTVPA